MSQGRAFPAGSRFLLGRQALLILDGCLWMLAGAAVVWLGLRAYGTLPRVGWVRPLLTFLLFQGLDGPFLAVTWKETRRIRGSAQPARRPIWQALAGKSWLVLAGSVGGSLWLWRSGWVPAEAAAVICTALGGALALAVANRVLMLENAVYAILSPEGFASILWKDAQRSGEAAKLMKLTAPELKKLGVIDGIVREPEGGAQTNHGEMLRSMDRVLLRELTPLLKESGTALAEQRCRKFRAMGRGKENA